MIRALILALAGSMVSSPALACTWCAASAFGDRTFNWPYLSLILAPFAIGFTIAGVLAYYHRAPQAARWRRRAVERDADCGLPPGGGDGVGPRAVPPLAMPLDKETT